MPNLNTANPVQTNFSFIISYTINLFMIDRSKHRHLLWIWNLKIRWSHSFFHYVSLCLHSAAWKKIKICIPLSWIILILSSDVTLVSPAVRIFGPDLPFSHFFQTTVASPRSRTTQVNGAFSPCAIVTGFCMLSCILGWPI